MHVVFNSCVKACQCQGEFRMMKLTICGNHGNWQSVIFQGEHDTLSDVIAGPYNISLLTQTAARGRYALRPLADIM